MTTKEEVIRKSITQVNKRLDKINCILNASPLTEILNIREEAQKLLDENKALEQRTSNEFISKIKALADREKEQFKIAEQANDAIGLINKKVELEMELSNLKTELYHIERVNKEQTPEIKEISLTPSETITKMMKDGEMHYSGLPETFNGK